MKFQEALTAVSEGPDCAMEVSGPALTLTFDHLGALTNCTFWKGCSGHVNDFLESDNWNAVEV